MLSLGIKKSFVLLDLDDAKINGILVSHLVGAGRILDKGWYMGQITGWFLVGIVG
jgi:hypothetical protein